MKYLNEIEAFFSKGLADVERDAFEHETMDNVDLAEEMGAYQTGMDLLDFTANNLSDEQILGLEKAPAISHSVQEGNNFSYSPVVIFLAVASILLLFAFFGDAILDEKGAIPDRPVEEKEQPTEQQIPIARKEFGESILAEHAHPSAIAQDKGTTSVIESLETANKKNRSLKAVADKPSNTHDRLETETKRTINEPYPSTELVSNASIGDGEEIVYQAGQQITLTPGFHAKPGSSFKAVVTRD